MRERPQGDRDPAEEARRLGVSPVHFRRLFARVTGSPPHRFLLEARLQSAARLLRTSADPLKEIAGRCGIYDEYHLSRLFRRRFGIAPGAYRKLAQLQS